MKEGSFVQVNYTGKIVASGEVFDTTVEKKAIDTGIFNEKTKYRPLTVIVGENELLKGLDLALKEMKVGEEKKVVLKPADAFGERNPKLVAVLPLREFKKQKMNPIPGLIVEVDGRRGKVQSVSGGRVRVDFNHPLAGKELEYELKVEKEIKGAKEKVEALFEKFFGMIPEKEKSVKVSGKVVEVGLNAKYAAEIGALKKRFSELITKHVQGIEKVRFVEEFSEKKEKTEEKKESNAGKKEKKAEEKK